MITLLNIDYNKFYIIGHRGNEVYDPENTIAAFKRAIEIGAEIIELDLQMTKDNNIVLFHDKKLNDKTNTEGNIINYLSYELKNVKYTYFKDKYEDLCFYDELIAFISNLNEPKPIFILELKYNFNEKAIKKIVSSIFLNKLENHIIIDSFLEKNLKLVQKYENLFLSQLFDPIPMKKIQKGGTKYLESIYQKCEKLNIKAISLHKDNLFDSIIKFFKEKGLIVFGWGVKKPSEYDKYVRIKGLNGFSASHPDYLIQTRKELLGY